MLKNVIKQIERMDPLRLCGMIFGLLVLIILITERPFVTSGAGSAKFLLPTMEAGNITRIFLAKGSPAQELELIKQGGQWTITQNELRAGTDQVTSLLNRLSDLNQMDVVAKNQDRHAVYGVDDATGLRVRIYGGDKPAGDLVFGQPAQDGAQYVRRFDEVEVIEAAPSLADLMDISLWQWMDRTMISVKPEEIEKITITKPKGDEVTIVRQPDGKWMVTSPEEYEPSKKSIDALLGVLADFKAKGFITSEDAGEFDIYDPIYKLLIRPNDGSALHVLYFVKQLEDGDFIVKNGSDKVIYLVGKDSLPCIFEADFK
jgi:hypothetical protein